MDLDAYPVDAAVPDDAFLSEGVPRQHWRPLHDALREWTVDEVAGLQEQPAASTSPASATVSTCSTTICAVPPGRHHDRPAEGRPVEPVSPVRDLWRELVQGADLVVDNGRVCMRATSGPGRQVDALYRHVDDDFLDPLVFRPDSLLGAPGLLHACKLGTVGLANAPGTGVADGPGVFPFVPDIIRYYCAEEPLLPNEATYPWRRPEDLEYTLDNLAHLGRLRQRASPAHRARAAPLHRNRGTRDRGGRPRA